MVCSQNMINRQRDTMFAPNIKMLVDILENNNT